MLQILNSAPAPVVYAYNWLVSLFPLGTVKPFLKTTCKEGPLSIETTVREPP